jgi:aerobic-type carbon monoxide dehydrogenase small subunit (CoxS/CutS family)
MKRVKLRVNGVMQTADDELPLGAYLRESLDLTGTKLGCGEGQCGSCTVLVDGRAEQSCTLTVGDVAGKSVTTIEGLARGARLHPMQEAFLKVEAYQCGYCTPGMILGAVSLLREKPRATEEEIKSALEIHVCRCGSYPRIVEAVRMAEEAMRRG